MRNMGQNDCLNVNKSYLLAYSFKMVILFKCFFNWLRRMILIK